MAQQYRDFPGGSEVKRLPSMRDPWVGKISWRRKWQPTPVLLPGKSHGWRSLVGYSPWGCKESDTTERLHFHFSLTHSHIFQVKHPWMQTANYSCQVRYWKGEMRKKQGQEKIAKARRHIHVVQRKRGVD